MGNLEDARKEMTKTREQLEEEKKISLSIRIKPLELDGKLVLICLIENCPHGPQHRSVQG